MESATRNTSYDDPSSMLNKPARPSVREELASLRTVLNRQEESIQTAHDRLQTHDQRITAVEREIGE